jgi:hypothetical protein
MVIVKASKESESGAMGTEQELREMGEFNEQLLKAGIMLSGEGLLASKKGARIQFSGAKRTVVDGPFAESKELVAGFWIVQTKSLAETVEWFKKCPFREGEIEVRQIAEETDFGDLVQKAPEVFAAERAAREKLASRH